MKLAILAAIVTGASSMPALRDWSKADEDAGIKELTDAGYPDLKAFRHLSPQVLKTVMGNYHNVLAPDAFATLSPPDLEIVFAAVSASNNCEMCLSFHMMMLGNPESPTGSDMPVGDIMEIAQGGLPPPEHARAHALVTAAKYSLAHKGIYLAREKKHLATLGFKTANSLYEINYATGIMAAMNSVYISMIADGLELEDFLQMAGPFQDTVYAKAKAAAAKAAAEKIAAEEL